MVYVLFSPRGKLISALIALALIVGCASPTQAPPRPPVTATPVPSLTSTSTDFPLLVNIPVSGETSTPEADLLSLPTRSTYLNLGPTLTAQAEIPSPTPFPTLAPAPTRTPMPTGRISGYNWGLIPSHEGLWAMRADGAQMTLLTNDPILHMTVSPSGAMVAYITHAEPIQPIYSDPFGYTLNILTLSDSKTYTVSSIDNQVDRNNVSTGDLDNAIQTISTYDRGGMAWSPDGRSLAFVSGQGGKNADIFLYTPSAARVVQLTHLDTLNNGQAPAHAYGINWSLDGQRIFFAAAYQFGTSGQGSLMAGAWTVSRDGQTVVQVAGPESTNERLLAWVGSNNLLLSSAREDCGEQNLRAINLSSQQVRVLWPGCFTDMLYNSYRQEILLSVSPALSGTSENNNPGLYLGSVSRGLSQISDHSFDRLYTGGSFTAPWYGYNQEEGLFSINRQGQINPIFTGQDYVLTPNRLRPAFRWPNPSTWIFTADDGLYLGRPGQAPVQLFNMPTSGLSIASSTGRLYFFVNTEEHPQFYSIRASDLKITQINHTILTPGSISWP